MFFYQTENSEKRTENQIPCKHHLTNRTVLTVRILTSNYKLIQKGKYAILSYVLTLNSRNLDQIERPRFQIIHRS